MESKRIRPALENGRVDQVVSHLGRLGVVQQLTFDGLPYLATSIGRTPLRHIALLPAERSRAQLLDLARRQARANRLDTCLCIGPTDAVYMFAEGSELAAYDLPWGIPVAGLLQTAEEFPATPEYRRREERLREFVGRFRREGYLVGDGLEGGRLATALDMALMQRRGENGVPTSLHRCPACRRLRGEYLALDGEGNGDRRPRVVFVHCRCDNHNRCARCGAPLAEDRLSSFSYDEALRKVLYLAAYAGLGHRCVGRPAGCPADQTFEGHATAGATSVRSPTHVRPPRKL